MHSIKSLLDATEKNNAALEATIATYKNSGAFNQRPSQDVWSAAENLQHLIVALESSLPAYYLPLFAMRLIFGKANRPSKTYDGLVEKYQAKLSLGIKAAGKYVPEQKIYTPATLLHKWITLDKRYRKLLSRASEERLETCIVPHPLLGKITVRELCFFTIYHTEHHHQIIKRIQV
jgi:DinB superfamily